MRAAEAATQVGATNDLLKFVQKSFENAAMAKVSASALDARAMADVDPQMVADEEFNASLLSLSLTVHRDAYIRKLLQQQKAA